jgi:hypothetical protein
MANPRPSPSLDDQVARLALLQNLDPGSLSFIQYVPHRMVSRRVYIKVEKEQKMRLIMPYSLGLDLIRDADFANKFQIQTLTKHHTFQGHLKFESDVRRTSWSSRS